MDKNLLKILVCPVTKGPLIYKKEQNDPFRFVNRGVNNPEIARAILSGESPFLNSPS